MVIALSIIILLLLAGAFYLYTQRSKDLTAYELHLQAEQLQKQQALDQAKIWQAEVQRLQTNLRSEQEKTAQARMEQASMQTKIEILEESIQTLRAQKQEISQELQLKFSQLATSIIDQRAEAIEKKSLESLSPLREDLRRFGEQVASSYNDGAKERASLQHEIRLLMERSMQISHEATNLTKALKGNSKIQGDWGEMILEHILEQSGLRKGIEYTVQETLRAEDGRVIANEESQARMRPDIIVHYPNSGTMVIDSKVSLTAYANYIATEDEAEQQTYAQAHLLSVRKHISELAQKGYHTYLKTSPNFVMLFIPNEPAYSLVMNLAPTLWEEAYKKGVVLINGTNLIAALRMAQDLWARDRQTKNIERIVEAASKLYDKFCSFSESFLRIEDRLSSTMETFQKAKGQLSDGRGNIIAGLEKLKEMGVTSKKELPKAFRPEEEEQDE